MPTYRFGDSHGAWKCSAPNLNAAIRMFRVSALFPATYASMPEPKVSEWNGRTITEIVTGYTGEAQRINGESVYLDAHPEAVIRVYDVEKDPREPVAMIPVWDVAAEAETMAILGQIAIRNAYVVEVHPGNPEAPQPGQYVRSWDGEIRQTDPSNPVIVRVVRFPTDVFDRIVALRDGVP